MKKAEQFDRAWRLAFKNGDFSLVDEIYHLDYSATDFVTGITVNLEDDKIIVSTMREQYAVGFSRTIFESEEFLCIHRFFGSKKAKIYSSAMTAIIYKNGKIVKQDTVSESLDEDPSECQDWNWEDYE